MQCSGPVHNVSGAQIAVRFPGYGCLEQGMTRTYVRFTTAPALFCEKLTRCCSCRNLDGRALGTSMAPASMGK
jgi:hypothetical protein